MRPEVKIAFIALAIVLLACIMDIWFKVHRENARFERIMQETPSAWTLDSKTLVLYTNLSRRFYCPCDETGEYRAGGKHVWWCPARSTQETQSSLSQRP